MTSRFFCAPFSVCLSGLSPLPLNSLPNVPRAPADEVGILLLFCSGSPTDSRCFSATPPAPPQAASAPAPIAITNVLKRKTSPAAEDTGDVDRKPIILPPGANLPVGEYEAGRVICEVCGGGVSFRDEPAGGSFTLKHWEAHRLTCGAPPHPPHPHPHPHAHAHAHTQPLVFAGGGVGDAAHLGPPAKRRRAKRTEEERIEYLRADAHVAQFEAYRVLCASCDKWIRLRPNSTYCSIPWDAHRKSCLAKKTNAKNIYALDERNALFAKDPDVRKFDSERLLCGMCDKWLTTPPDDHLGAVQAWLQHRATCQKTVSALKNVIFSVPSANASTSANVSSSSMMGDAEERKPVVSPPPTASASAGPSYAHRTVRAAPAHAHPHVPHHPHPHSAPSPSQRAPHSASAPAPPTHLPLPDAPHLLLDLSPANYAAPHESRRRNAEQRAATLRADVLIREVEPNRVFCSLCTKWVQLRQDSSYCAYPWLQHRGKCLARYAPPRAAGTILCTAPPRKATSLSRKKAQSPPGGAARAASRRSTRRARSPRATPPHAPCASGPRNSSSSKRDADGDPDADAEGEDVDADGDSYMEDDAGTGATPTRGYGSNHNNGGYGAGASAILRRAVPASLADLDSPEGRRAFVFASVEYLFRTTYEASDDMSISSLLAYLNAAVPADKHEDFDTGEVARAASALAARDKDRFALEGDMLRLLREA
ncbi:hypothetical protein DFH09DRAFT_1092389 [Mycena vulgaris]|nr:hypothetical protein DFH09DRAFT_1092389 [Mycena vulgaris]